jgi:class 3 adenylate cyclase
MTSERIQRRIDSLLDEADAAVGDGEWERVRERARDVLAFAPDNAEARAFLEAAERRLAPTEQAPTEQAPTEQAPIEQLSVEQVPAEESRGRRGRGQRGRGRSRRRGQGSGQEERPGALALGFRQLRDYLAEEQRASRRRGQRGRGLRSAAGGRAVTILFTDMRGSTQLTQQLGDERAHQIVRQHNQSVREALEARQGREIKHTGDGIMASFLSASAAVECALDVQQRISASGDRTGGDQGPATLEVRIGINAGEAIADDEDLFGTAVIMASRICDRAEPGQVPVSDVVRQLCAGKTFEFSSTGEATLKDFDQAVTLHDVRPAAAGG